MRHAWVSKVSMVTLVGGMVLSAGLVLMADRALAEKEDEDRGSATGLSGVTQNWDKNLPSASRFTVLAAFGGAAVRDNNTGLVWEQAPNATSKNWRDATAYCVNKNIGGTRGWRLPSVVELASLLDPSLPPPSVPGSVFTGVQLNSYWSNSKNIEHFVWIVHFDTGNVVLGTITDGNLSWCVRGPWNADTYQ
jgi:hypothetical protein